MVIWLTIGFLVILILSNLNTLKFAYNKGYEISMIDFGHLMEDDEDE